MRRPLVAAFFGSLAAPAFACDSGHWIAMRAYIIVAGVALALVAVWAALVPFVA